MGSAFHDLFQLEIETPQLFFSLFALGYILGNANHPRGLTVEVDHDDAVTMQIAQCAIRLNNPMIEREGLTGLQ